MKKMMNFIARVKFIAAGVFCGLIGFYMVVGTLYTRFRGLDFDYAIPFAFIIHGAAFALVTATLWEVFFGETIKHWRFIVRALAFDLLLALTILACFATSFILPQDWAHLWLAGVLVIAVGIAVISCVCEWYFRKTGERYNEMLRVFKGE